MSKYEIKKWFWELIFQVVDCRHRRKANLNISIRSLVFFFLLRLDKRKNINFVQKAFYSGSRGLFGGNRRKDGAIATFDFIRCVNKRIANMFNSQFADQGFSDLKENSQNFDPTKFD